MTTVRARVINEVFKFKYILRSLLVSEWTKPRVHTTLNINASWARLVVIVAF